MSISTKPDMKALTLSESVNQISTTAIHELFSCKRRFGIEASFTQNALKRCKRYDWDSFQL